MNRQLHLPLESGRRRVIVGALLASVVLGGAGVTALHLSTTSAYAEGQPVAAPPAAATAVAVDPAVEGARNRLTLALFTAPGVLAGGAGKAPAEQLAALQVAIDTATAALGSDMAVDVLAALDGVEIARTAVETSIGAWTAEQERVAAEGAAQAQAAAAAVQAQAAAAAKADADRAQRAATRAATAATAPAPPAELPVPESVTVVAPAAPALAPEDPELANRDANAWYTADLVGVGATGFTISNDWASCGQPDAGPTSIQGCASSAHPTVIYMKVIDVAIARSESARGVVIHEWAHLLQYRLGYWEVEAAADAVYGAGVGLEQSADCMAIQLGAKGRPGGYTSDCSGARGTVAAAFLAGRLQ